MTTDVNSLAIQLNDMFGPMWPHVLNLVQAASFNDVDTDRDFNRWGDDPNYDGNLTVVDELLFDKGLELRTVQMDLSRNLVSAAAADPTGERSLEEFDGNAGIAAVRVATALATRDLIPADIYDALTVEWRTILGRVHPDDPESVVG